ncbi:MAG TPA: undecaprenyldiphospho-muramoylpentapeptide beta-N-acetylglucosaminyltransferase [Candidatus Saccharimonadia bacterium]|nr:undecaprenyldiphospho-muramoylpentapeptide beta-N-acetylglucosaminyltransferase [Candidatus Saccharimonadia bacterium]
MSDATGGIGSANAPVLIMAGGTGGHIFPGIAVALELVARGVPVVWLGSERGLENELVPKAGFALERIAVSGVRGKGLRTLFAAPWRILRAVQQALAVVRRLRPRAAIAFGGFASGPGGIAAWIARRPLLVHEQNRVPGYTNRALARFARRVLAGFPDAFARGAEDTGNPVRAEIAALAPPQQRMASRGGAMRLLVLGGSQGARTLNRALPQVLRALPPGLALDVLHQSGRALLDETRAAYGDAAKVRIEPFLDDMAAAYAEADLVVCRAGALTVAELAAAGVASVLVPFAAAVDDHQTRNAEYLVEHGAAIRVRDDADVVRNLGAVVASLLRDRPRLLAMASAARSLARPDAAARIADACLAEACPSRGTP